MQDKEENDGDKSILNNSLNKAKEEKLNLFCILRWKVTCN